MGKIKKKVTVRFFSMDSAKEFFEDFIASYNASWINEKPIRSFNIRDKKHLVKIYSPMDCAQHKAFFLAVVRERTTWQARALSDGSISGIHSNQGLIGDLYYYLVVPASGLILGFTTGPNASVRSVANVVLQQFKKDRSSRITLKPISNQNEYTKLNDLSEFTEMRFSLNPALLNESDDEMPDIFRELKASPFMANSSKLELTIVEFGEEGFTHEALISAVDYLADNECCISLYVKGINSEGEKIQLDLNRAYLAYSRHVQLKGNFIDEQTARDIALAALESKIILQ